MKKKSAQILINLVPKDPFFDTLIGRILRWALSAGRYIVIFTELVVIVSFVSRFTLDRQVTDLNQSIQQKEAIVDSYGPLEENFRASQAKVSQYEQIEQEANIAEVFASLSAVTPDGVVLEDLIISQSAIVASGRSLSQASFNLLVNNLQLSPDFQNVTVDKIESTSQKDPGFDFQVRANTKVIEAVKQVQQSEPIDALDRTGGL